MEQQINDAALVFVRQASPQHLARDRRLLVDRGIRHLQERFDIPTGRAERIVVRAIGEVDSANTALIDTTSTTDSMVVVRHTKTGLSFAVTAADIFAATNAAGLAIPIGS